MTALRVTFLIGLAASIANARLQGRSQNAGQLDSFNLGGSTAALNEAGYQLVASLKSDKEMGAFISRLLASEGMKVSDTRKMDGFVPYFSGTTAAQSLRQLRTELEKAQWVERATNLEVDLAMETLKTERVSSFSNASAYAVAIANALESSEGSVKVRIFVESDLYNRPMKALAAELFEASQDGAKVVLQRLNGQVQVTDAEHVAVDIAKMPMEYWDEAVQEQAKKDIESKSERDQEAMKVPEHKKETRGRFY